MKQTEIGMIPDDWEVKEFKNVTNRITVGIANSATQAYTDRGVIMFRNQNIKENMLDFNDLIYIKKEFADRYNNKQLKGNDLLIARTGYPGTTCVVPEKYAGSQTFTTLIATPKKDVIDSNYCAYFFNSEIGIKLFSAAQIGGAQKNVNAHTLSKTIIPLPPTLSEQQKIAKALSDVDNVISTLEKLITKKKNLKQGTMQQLLTGKKRLPGFAKSTAFKQTEIGEIPEDWEVVKLNAICDLLNGDRGNNYPKDEDMVTIGIPFINAGHLKNGTIDMDNMDYISNNLYLKLSGAKIKKNDILFCLRGSLGKNAIVNFDKGAPASSLCVIRHKKIDEQFIFQLINSFVFDKQISDVTTGSSQPNLSAKDVSNFKIPLPGNEDEQNQIGNTLTLMDTEINELNVKLEKYQNLKIGMMQQLLTGKIRLR